jgi:uncharacterized membrane protein YdbT with pleckstrin-like domain
MDVQNPYKTAVEPQSNIPLAAMRPGEREIFNLKRHPIGILGIYIVCALLMLVMGIVIFVIAPTILPDQTSQINTIGAVVYLIAVVVIGVFAFISSKVYWGNSWILTSDSITQIKQTSLFDRQSSQLSLANLEDVTAEQNGIFTHMFNYGTIKAETAGEHSKFHFYYCPNPNEYAKQIVEAREEFEQTISAE